VNHYPYWDDEAGQIASVVRPLGTVAAHRRAGVVTDSYLEDGHSGIFADFRSIVGWAMLERHLVEGLCGAAYTPGFGGLKSDPFLRAAVFRALELTGPADGLLDTYYHGDTVGHVGSVGGRQPGPVRQRRHGQHGGGCPVRLGRRLSADAADRA
jgi:hypothetical protein